MRRYSPRFPLGRTSLVAGALALALLVGHASVQAEVPLGNDAPDVVGQEFLNTKPMKLSDLSGRLILLELFTTT